MLELHESRQWCARTMRDHAKSFYLATRLLPAQKRLAVEAFYGFCRNADDTADEPGMDERARRNSFARMRAALSRATPHGSEGHFPWFAALSDAFRRFPIDAQDAVDLLDGCERDLGNVHLRTLDELEAYAKAVAGTVGRVTMCILGAHDDDSLRRGTKLGIAMQLTNALRDVQEDCEMGRVYVPFAAFPRLGETDVMRVIARKAREYYCEAPVLAARVPNDGSRLSIILARNLYEGILDVIERRGFDWRRGRAVVSLPEKIGITSRSILTAYAGFATIR